MNYYPINMIHTSQESTKEGSNEELEGIFYIKQSNQLKQKSLNTQPSPSPQPFINLRGKEIRMSGLYIPHINVLITPKDKF